MSVRIIIDSACDYVAEEAEKKNCTFLPLRTMIDGVEYFDGVTISHEEFYERLVQVKDLPVTSQVTPFDYEKAYEEAHAKGEEILVITLSSKLSGTYQSANIATQDKDYPIFVVDSENVSVGERVLVDYAIELRDLNLTAKQIADELNRMKKHIVVFAIVDTLEYLQKGGRLSKTAAIAGNMFRIKPILSIVEGKLVVAGKAHGLKQGCSHLNKMIENKGGVDFDRPIMLAYTGNDDSELRKYIDNSQEIWKNRIENLPITSAGSTIGTHAGPGMIGIAFFEKKR